MRLSLWVGSTGLAVAAFLGIRDSARADTIAFEPAAISIDVPTGWSRSVQADSVTLTEGHQDAIIAFGMVDAGSNKNAADTARRELEKRLQKIAFTPEESVTIAGMRGVAFGGHAVSGNVSVTLVIAVIDTPADKDLLVIAFGEDAKLARHQGEIAYVLDHVQPTTAANPAAPSPEQSPATDSKNLSVYASAPPTLSTADLGRPCDDSFHRIPGRLGSPLYARRKGTVAGSSGFQSEFLEADDTRELQANAEGWGIGAGSVDRAKQRRYVVYRASQQDNILEVDDTVDPAHEPPPEAKWYIASIFVGRSYEIVVEGDKTKFNVGVRAKIKAFDLGMSKLTESGFLHITAKGRGLVPKNDSDGDGLPDDALFAKSPQEIAKAYKASTDPVPMYVEYRSIPGRDVAMPAKLEWASEPVPDNVVVERDPVQQCYCGNHHNINVRCQVRNMGGRPMDVTVGATAETGSMNYSASGAGRVQGLSAGQTTTIWVDAAIDGAFMDCSSAKSCVCRLNASYPSQ
ncbi:MAG TPA: hypothetical protein VMJ10_06220 [Kofleriaceae bacterium]|nr:hypothetical protein [Kofleriaceae bacterium]